MTASLPMYDLPEIRAATDDWWQGIVRALAHAGITDLPMRPERERPREQVWRDAALIVTQTCGYPLRHAFSLDLQSVVVPCYRADGCTGPHYRSAIVAREDDRAALPDYAGRRFAGNGPDSQSGCNVMRALVAPLVESRAGQSRFFGEVIWTGAHRHSLAAVRENRADIAAIDAVTYALIADHAPEEIAGLKILSWSDPAPSLPYATATARPTEFVNRLRAGLLAAAADPSTAAARDTLRITAMQPVTDADYDAVVAMRQSAERAGYSELD